MKPMDVVRRLDRAQKGLAFKIIASGVVVLAAIVVIVTYVVTVEAMKAPDLMQRLPTAPVDEQQARQIEEVRPIFEATQRALDDVFGARKSTASVAVGTGVVAGLALVVIWLGLGLSYLALMAAAALVVMPLWSMPQARDTGRLLGGIVALSASFLALMEGARLLLGIIPGAVCAVARNVLTESVRLKVSLLFIVLLILGLSAVPGLLQETSPLRYRVQSFLQYGTSGAFWMIALLTLLLSAASVTFEQRDRVIWQTMTKPVAAWEYIGGKWLGVCVLNGVLLLVCGSAVFMFTEYLRGQRAHGELEPYVTAGEPGTISDDRRILHFQVLQARVAVEPAVPPLIEFADFDRIVDNFVINQRQLVPDFEDTPQVRRELRDQLRKELETAYRSIEPGNNETYKFIGLGAARDRATPVVLRYRIESGSNYPGETYRLSFLIGGLPYVRQVSLGHMQVIDNIPPTAIDSDGTLTVRIINGDVFEGIPNPMTLSFPPGGLQVTYSVGSYRLNFLRVMLVLWLKLAFLSILAITASTFLSFPVACLIAFGAFFVAEGAGFLKESADVYTSGEDPGVWRFVQIVVGPMAHAIAWSFQSYANLDPITRLVDGRLLPWVGADAKNPGVLRGLLTLGVWSVVMYGVAVLIFRRRELATYSGQ